MQSQSINQEKPALFKQDLLVSNPVISLFQHLSESDLDGDFRELVTENGAKTGFLFLFEIPGSLFDKADFRAAALISTDNNNSERVLFVLCNQDDQVIEVYDEVEVPQNISDFVGSYANVLACLQSLESCGKLH